LAEFDFAYKYIGDEFKKFEGKTQEISKLINYMILNPEKFGSSKDL
jgi:hypothetical protein